jgi:hypothetical protein
MFFETRTAQLLGSPSQSRTLGARHIIGRILLCVMTEVTRILQKVETGDLQAAKKLLPLVYDELRRLAVITL